jgi:CheY-like chemotaxis protein
MSESLQGANEREWLFASIIEGVPGFLYCMNDAGHILASNHGFKEKIGANHQKINYEEIARAFDFDTEEMETILEDDYSGFFKEGRWEKDFLSKRDGKAPRYFKIHRQVIKKDDQIQVIGLLVVIQEQMSLAEDEVKPKEPKIEVKLERAPRVLVIEDYIVARLHNRLMFKKNGCEVDMVETEKEALALFDTNNYDLVMMDLMLPDSVGRIVTKQIRKKEALLGSKRVPVIALTTKEARDVLKDCKDYQMNGYIHKPMSGMQAKQLIERYVFNKDVKVDDMIVIE